MIKASSLSSCPITLTISQQNRIFRNNSAIPSDSTMFSRASANRLGLVKLWCLFITVFILINIKLSNTTTINNNNNNTGFTGSVDFELDDLDDKHHEEVVNKNNRQVHYTNEFALALKHCHHNPDDETTAHDIAQNLADKYGFINHGKVCSFISKKRILYFNINA